MACSTLTTAGSTAPRVTRCSGSHVPSDYGSGSSLGSTLTHRLRRPERQRGDLHGCGRDPGDSDRTGSDALGAKKQAWYTQRVVIVGTDADRERVRRTVERHPDYGLKIVGETQSRVAVPDTAGHNGEERERLTDLGSLIALVVERDADRVIFGSAYHPALEERTGALRFLAEHGVKVDLVPADSDALPHRCRAASHRGPPPRDPSKSTPARDMRARLNAVSTSSSRLVHCS